jgi:hypothetical protein
MNSVLNRRLRLGRALLPVTLTLLMAVSLVGITAITAQAAAGDGSGTMTVSPPSVSAGSTNTFALTYTARGGGGLTGQVTVDVAAGFTAPQVTSSADPGFVSITGGTCASKTIAGVSGQTVTINMTCGSSQTFVLNYANATSPTAPGSYPFLVKSKGSASGAALAALTAGSPVVTVNPGAATTLVFSTQPGGATAGAPFGQQPVVKTQDSVGNDTTAGLPTHLDVTVTLSAGTGSLQGTTTLDIGTAAGNGIVGYTDLRIDSAGSKQLTASASGLTSAVSDSFTVTAGALAEIRISPTTATIASGGSQNYTAEGFDGSGNSLGDVTGDTTFTIEPDGSCSGASCSATQAGDHTVTGTDGAFSDTATLTVAAEPTISSSTPTVGFVRKKVILTGSGFTNATDVTFAGQSGTVTASFSVDSDTQISTRVPDGAVTGPISVTTPGGTATSSTSFKVRPKISGFTPSSGPVGTSVTINGFTFLGATTVKFNGVRATFTVVDYHTITATVPARATTGLVGVVTPSGNAKSPRSFTVT